MTALPILLVHAAGGAARNFGSVLRRLPGAAALDLPGHGRAGGEALRTLDELARFVLERAPDGPVLLGGHSMGGAVAMTAAALAPERVRGLALLATGARLEAARRNAPRARADFEGFLALLRAEGAPLMTVESLRQAGAETVARDLEACVGFDGLGLAPAIRVPTLLLAGERDTTAPPALRALADAIAGSTYLEVPGAGHVIPVEAPDAVAAALAELRGRVNRGLR